MEVCLYKCQSVLHALHAVTHSDPGLPTALALALRRVVFTAGCTIVHQGQDPGAMYFVERGELSTRSRSCWSFSSIFYLISVSLVVVYW